MVDSDKCQYFLKMELTNYVKYIIIRLISIDLNKGQACNSNNEKSQRKERIEMPEYNKCADVVPGTIVNAGAAIKQHQQNEDNGVFNAVVWARALIAKAMLAEAPEVQIAD